MPFLTELTTNAIADGGRELNPANTPRPTSAVQASAVVQVRIQVFKGCGYGKAHNMQRKDKIRIS